MKKFLVLLTLILFSSPISAIAQIQFNDEPLTLYEYYANKGEVLPPIVNVL